MFKNNTDEEIIELYFARSENAIAETDRKYGEKCLKISVNIVGDVRDGEECVNDTYLAVWDAIPPSRPDPFSVFLYRITRNISLKRYAYNTALKRNSHYDAAFDELADVMTSDIRTDDEIEAKLTSELIERFLDGLSRENRVIFLRRYWFSDSYADISVRVGLQEKVISMRLSRMRTQLRKYLENRGILI